MVEVSRVVGKRLRGMQCPLYARPVSHTGLFQPRPGPFVPAMMEPGIISQGSRGPLIFKGGKQGSERGQCSPLEVTGVAAASQGFWLQARAGHLSWAAGNPRRGLRNQCTQPLVFQESTEHGEGSVTLGRLLTVARPGSLSCPFGVPEVLPQELETWRDSCIEPGSPYTLW
jgi:hypothetical protein